MIRGEPQWKNISKDLLNSMGNSEISYMVAAKWGLSSKELA